MQNVQRATDGPVAIVTIDRPSLRNAVDRQTAEELAEVFRAIEREDDVSVAVLTGADGTFCAGADLKSGSNRLGEDGDGPMGISRFLLSKPTIAAVEGYAVAGGLELALWCDLRVAAEDAIFGVFCRRWGVPLMDGGTVRLARQIGHSHALDMILTGRPVAGEEALRMGLANRLVRKGAALAEAISLAKDIAKFPQATMRSDRLSSYEQWNLSLPEALHNEFRRGMEILQSGAVLGGLEMFAKTAGRSGTLRHAALGTPMLPPFPDGMEVATFAMGPFHGAERVFWQADGVFTTAVGYTGGAASSPTHEEVSRGQTGYVEAVRVVFDPTKTSYAALLRIFWEAHDPTKAAPREGPGSQHRSAIYCSTAEQRSAASASRDAYQRALTAAGHGEITTEISDATEFHCADEPHQQHLAKNPGSHDPLTATNVRHPGP